MDLCQTNLATRFFLPSFCLQQFEHLQFSSPNLGSTDFKAMHLAAMAQTQIVGHLILGPAKRFTERFELLWRHVQKFTSVNRHVKAGYRHGLLAFSRRSRLEGLLMVTNRRPTSFRSSK